MARTVDMRRGAASRLAAPPLLVVLACALLASSPPAAALDGPADVRESVAVNVVNVDAFVTDGKGNPVHGLQVGDFDLTVDGVAVPISNFLAANGEEIPPPGTQVPEEQQLLLVLFVDGLNMTPTQRRAVFGKAEALLGETLRRPGARVMIVSGGLNVSIRQTFTSDPQQALAALATMEGEAGEGASALSQDGFLRTMIESAPGPDAGGSDFNSQDRESIKQSVRAAAQQSYERTRAAVQNLTTFVGSLGGLPGRKALFYVGGGIPMRPGEALLQRLEAKLGGFSAVMEANRYDVSSLVHNLAAKANANGVTFYCVDAAGNRNLGDFSAASRFMESQPGVDAAAGMASQGGMQYLAAVTGGEAAINRPDLSDVLVGMVGDFCSNYSLGFAMTYRGDGAAHQIKVRVRREGAKVRTRAAFTDLKADDRLIDRTFAALLFDIAANPLGIQVFATSEPPNKEQVQKVNVLVTIPLGVLTFLPKGAAHEAKLTIILAARDGEERIVQAPRASFPISVGNDKLLTALGQNAGYTFQLPLRAGTQRVAVTVRDETGLALSSAAAAVTVAPPTPTATVNPS